jgi:hypothetical protein
MNQPNQPKFLDMHEKLSRRDCRAQQTAKKFDQQSESSSYVYYFGLPSLYRIGYLNNNFDQVIRGCHVGGVTGVQRMNINLFPALFSHPINEYLLFCGSNDEVVLALNIRCRDVFICSVSRLSGKAECRMFGHQSHYLQGFLQFQSDERSSGAHFNARYSHKTFLPK